MDACFDGAGRCGEAGADRAARRGRSREHQDRGTGRLDGDHGVVVAQPVSGQGSGRAGRCPAAWSASHAGSPTDRGRDLEAAAEEAGRDALVLAAPRRPVGDLQHHDRESVALLRHQAVEGGVVPVLHRPRTDRQGHRHLRALPGPTGERDRAVRGREVPDPGPGPHGADLADARRAHRAPAPRPCSRPSTSPAGRSPRR